jgi:hypothetical protein
MTQRRMNPLRVGPALLLLTLGAAAPRAQTAPAAPTTVVARVVALDQPFMWNRLGASQPNGMVYALEADVVPLDTPISPTGEDLPVAGPRTLVAGQVRLRAGKRPRPLVLRVNKGEILEIEFTNLLAPAPRNAMQVATRTVSAHVMGLELAAGAAMPARVGRNPDATTDLAAPGEHRTYRYFAQDEGTFILHPGSGWLGDLERSQGGLVGAGLFGSVIVQPEGAEYYRSQVTRADLEAATTGHTPDGHPLLDYQAVYASGPRAGLPILNMTRPAGPGRRELVSGDLTAIVTGPNAGRFPENHPSASFAENPLYPDRHRPYREIVVHYHQFLAVQAFPQFYDPQLFWMLLSAQDNFAINYGMAGIGAEVLANRLGLGPAGRPDAVDLKYEEFFLSSWANGDPAMVVDVPANAPMQVVSSPAGGTQTTTQTLTPPSFASVVPAGRKATKAFYPDDPSNVYHSYLNDPTKFRILHPGQGISHVHHQHAQQWLHSPKSDTSTYLDSQLLTPGAAYTLDIVHGSGNENHTAGDSLFHCHFYVHFATGMWAIWRNHDVMELGTALDASGRPLSGTDATGQPIWNRAYPDAEIATGTPIPAVVPLPTLPMAPLPAPVRLVDDGRRVEVKAEVDAQGARTYINPGFPFFIPGVAGHRAPHPPMDFAWEQQPNGDPKLDANGKPIPLDGGLPRHMVLDGEIVNESHTRWDFTKEFVRYDRRGRLVAGGLVAYELPNDGTDVERAAMAKHGLGDVASFTPSGESGAFQMAGRPPVPGAPFADPRLSLLREAGSSIRRYQAAVVQSDVVLNKKGWHQPQQRMLSLWQDVAPTLSGKRPPEPLFVRSNSGDTIEYWHTNLVPGYYELDDFLVRTPTDILGQHIHLVKYDVLASDGAANGFNYEDGTFSPDEVRARIDAINARGGLYGYDAAAQFIDRRAESQRKLTAKPAPAIFGTAPRGQNWTGAQTTIQRWDSSPVLDGAGNDRTMRTVFTHDHFGASTHQSSGLYGALLTEPIGSRWVDSITGKPMHTRTDGGPTSWQAIIATPDPRHSYREFALITADSQLAWAPSRRTAAPASSPALFNANGREAEGLARGVISPALRDRFARAGVSLSASAKVTPDARGWIVRDSSGPHAGDAFLVRRAQLFSMADADGAFARELDAGSLSGAALRFAMASTAGLSPNAGATLHTVTRGREWRLENPLSWLGRDGTRDEYTIRAANGRLTFEGLKIYPMQDPPRTDYPHSLNAFFDGVNAANGPPYPMMVNAFPIPGTYALNYRSEPVPFRVADPRAPSVTPNRSAVTRDLAHAFRSIPRLDPAVSGDPFTPILRAYENDNVMVRAVIGANHHPHYFDIDGVKWLFEPAFGNSGFRNSQGFGTSEHFEFLFTLPPGNRRTDRGVVDRLYRSSSSTGGMVNGAWGLLRAYDGRDGKAVRADLVPLPGNPKGTAPWHWSDPDLVPPGATVRRFDIIATTAAQALPEGRLTYNSRGQVIATGPARVDPRLAIDNPYALIYVRAEDLDASGRLKTGVPIEPLILRVNAGDWIEVTLTNKIDPARAALGASAFLPFSSAPPGSPFSTAKDQINFALSYTVGLRPQMLAFDPANAGINVGRNPVSTVVPESVNPARSTITYRWYAGELVWNARTQRVDGRPIEFGATNLSAADPLLQHRAGLIGALIVEPPGATWTEDAAMRASATVTPKDGPAFREFVLMMSDDATLYSQEPLAVIDAAFEAALARREFSLPLQQAVAKAGIHLPAATSVSVEHAGRLWLLTDRNTVVAIRKTSGGLGVYNTYQQAVNYRTEPLPLRYPLEPDGWDNDLTDLSNAFANSQVGGDPQTPIFTATAGTPVRFRLAHPDGVRPVRPNGLVFFISGHGWQELPHRDGSTRLGRNPLSETVGSRERHGPLDHFDILIDSAGGANRVPGDFFYGAYPSDEVNGGTWGIFRVLPPAVRSTGGR